MTIGSRRARGSGRTRIAIWRSSPTAATQKRPNGAFALGGVCPPVRLLVSFLFGNSPAQRSLARRPVPSPLFAWWAGPALCGLLAGAAAPAQDAAANQYEGRPIGRIEFDPPNQPLPRAELERLLPFQAGTTIQMAGLRAAIQRIYPTRRLS